MKTNILRRQKTSYYRWEKLRLEALLAVVQHKDDLFSIIRKQKTEEDAIAGVASHFNLSIRQAHYLLGLGLREFGALNYEELQKEYEKILRYCQILAPNNKKS